VVSEKFKDTPPPPVNFPISDEEAKRLIQRLSGSLKSELSAALKRGGPVEALTACSIKAPALTAAATDGVLRVRRIGTRTRNPKNTPSKAELELLGRLSHEAPTLREGGRVYHAIFTGPICLTCHGEIESMSQELRALISQKYPGDQAIGYQVGDLRGAFVVEP
jgi:hypothetical protein